MFRTRPSAQSSFYYLSSNRAQIRSNFYSQASSYARLRFTPNPGTNPNSSQNSKFTRRKALLSLSFLSLPLLSFSAITISPESLSKTDTGNLTQFYSTAVYRSFITCNTAVKIIIDYKALLKDHGHKEWLDEEYRNARKKVHARSAKRILHLAERHGGIYMKAAQHLGSLVHVVPKEYTDILSVLQDRAPFRPFSEIVEVFEQEFEGKHPTELFQRIDPTPIAAASLAQVHKAWTHDGEMVAVKVQYPDVERNFEIDLKTLEIVNSILPKIFPSFKLTHILNDFKNTLSSEFNFQTEHQNSLITNKLISPSHDPYLYIPKVIDHLSTRRVLTMEFIQGWKVNDIEGLRREGKFSDRELEKLAKVCVAVFADMIFNSGWVHCDPHPGNILIRRDPETGIPQLTLLDHGLYRALSPAFRTTYCNLWLSLLLPSESLLREVARELNIEDHWELLPLAFTGRPISASPSVSPSTTSSPDPSTTISTTSISASRPTANSDQSIPKIGSDLTAAEKEQIKSMMKQHKVEDVYDVVNDLDEELVSVVRVGGLVGGLYRSLMDCSVSGNTSVITNPEHKEAINDSETSEDTEPMEESQSTRTKESEIERNRRRKRDLTRFRIFANYAIYGLYFGSSVPPSTLASGVSSPSPRVSNLLRSIANFFSTKTLWNFVGYLRVYLKVNYRFWIVIWHMKWRGEWRG
ncbi:ABC1 family-domain-containing protein [Paraphysoderma sedebokerense]|nr:ABC1 family-domain-containing protein [Paraphysoderma sedebokerense]